ncbi:MAG TPA: VWA domain-containing protein [Candidatus Methanoperedens sp.]|nr:VWA domain-containing protein [Candidatus Methanoperedens sp.]
MIQWGDARFLPWLWALVPLAALLVLLVARRERRLRLLLDAPAVARLAPDRRPAVLRVKTVLRFAACSLAIVALARPQWGIRWQEERRRGLDVLVVLDTSASMLATDLKPNRMQRARLGLSDLLPRLAGDRIGLVAFAGSSFLACPLTTDYAAFSMVLEDVRPGVIPRGGTAIAQALESALANFDTGGTADRVVLLVTDGEDHEGGLERAIDALRRRQVRVIAVGLGSSEGDFIPAAGAGGPFLKDRSGTVVRTALREEPLRRIAAATGGTYFSAAAGDFGWDRVLRLGLANLERDERESRLVQVHEERFPWFLGAALLLLALEAAFGDRRRVPQEGAR